MSQNAANGGSQIVFAASLDGFCQAGLPLLFGSLQPLLCLFFTVSLLLAAAVLTAALLQDAIAANSVLLQQLLCDRNMIL